MKILIFDTETTGLPPRKINTVTESTAEHFPYIVQLSYIIYDTQTNRVLDIENKVIKFESDTAIPQDSIAIHKISNHISQTIGRPIKSILDEFMKHYSTADKIVAHNISFDINMILAELYRYPEKTRSQKSTKNYFIEIVKNSYSQHYCTMQNSKLLCNLITNSKYTNMTYLKYPRLSETCFTLFGNTPNPDNMHDALNDSIICLWCFSKLHPESNIDISKNKLLRTKIKKIMQNTIHR